MQKEIYFAGGCFWGMQAYFDALTGVTSTLVGYANGNIENPTYEKVCTGTTDFAETLKLEYDASIVSLTYLLTLYFEVIDPTAYHRQGHDVGSQYRTGIYYVEESDKPCILEALQILSTKYDKPIVVECKPLLNFYPAEGYHQGYLQKNPNGYCHISHDKIASVKELVPPPVFQKQEDAVLRKTLSKEAYEVTQKNATEPPFQNAFWDHEAEGIYIDVTTKEPLFYSFDKFASGCGWPSFTKPMEDQKVIEKSDTSHLMKRVEVRSRLGDAHLGHVFEDGPSARGGLRYCINSAALEFIPKEEMQARGYGAWLKAFKD